MTESRLPPLAVILSIAALIPFVVCALGAVRSDPAGGQINALALIDYGAVVLAFLGGVHWGFVLEGPERPAERRRLALGVMPGLVGWGAAVLGVLAHPVFGLAALIAGYIATVVVEGRAHRMDLVPRGYMLMRWGFTVVVVAVLTTVLVLRLIGGHLMF
jgi:Protein of unknown function (DUF3429)